MLEVELLSLNQDAQEIMLSRALTFITFDFSSERPSDREAFYLFLGELGFILSSEDTITPARWECDTDLPASCAYHPTEKIEDIIEDLRDNATFGRFITKIAVIQKP
jgi:hypothetical protein